MINLSFPTIILTIINVLFLFWLMKKLLFKRVMGTIEKRQELLKSQFDDAAGRQKQADELKEQYQKQLSDADSTAEKIVSDAKKTAEEEKARVLAGAEAEASEIRRRAQDDAEKAKIRAQEEVKAQVGVLAMAAARRILEQKEETHEEGQ